MAPTRTSDDGQHWLWCGRKISTMDGDYPRIVYAAILAHRDAVTEEERDIAEVLVWTVEEHPPWSGSCPWFEGHEPCPDQKRGDVIALEYLIRKSNEIMARCATRKDVA